MSEQDVFILADEALKDVVSQIKDDQWDVKIPEWFQLGGTQKDLTLREVINYHAYDDAWVPDILAGKTMDEAGKDKFDGDLLKDDPKGNFAALVEKAVAAAKALDDPERIVHLTYGDFKAKEYLQHITSFRGFRVYDISKLIGADTTMPDDLVAGMWDQLSPHAEEWRQMGVFGPAIEVPADASLQAKLLAMAGRQP